MAKIVSIKSELQVLRGLCHHDRGVSGSILAATDESYFYDEQNLIDRYETAIKKLGIDFIVIGCNLKYIKNTNETIFKNWILLKSFLTDKEKEKEILKMLEIF